MWVPLIDLLVMSHRINHSCITGTINTNTTKQKAWKHAETRMLVWLAASLSTSVVFHCSQTSYAVKYNTVMITVHCSAQTFINNILQQTSNTSKVFFLQFWQHIIYHLGPHSKYHTITRCITRLCSVYLGYKPINTSSKLWNVQCTNNLVEVRSSKV